MFPGSVRAFYAILRRKTREKERISAHIALCHSACYIAAGSHTGYFRMKLFPRQHFCTNYGLHGLVLVLLLYASGGLHAQQREAPSLGRFIIGADAVGPSTRYPVPNTHENGGTYMRYVTGAETAEGGEQTDIPLERWEQLRHLGIDCAMVTLAAEAMRGDGVRRLRRMAAEHGLALGLSDRGIADGPSNYSGAERRLYHPESPYMAADTAGLHCVDDDALRIAGYDASVFPLTPWQNAVRFPGPASTVGGYLLDRGYRNAAGLIPDGSKLRDGGVYYLSLRLRFDGMATPFDDMIPNDSTVVLRLTIADEDDATEDEFMLRGSDFYGPAGIIDTAHEFLLDVIRVNRQPSGRMNVQRGLIDRADTAMQWHGMNTGPVIVPAPGERRMPWTITYMPDDPRRPIIHLDALGLSCGKTFGLFNPGHPALPHTWHPTPLEFLARHIDTLCGDADPPRPLFIHLQESVGNDGNFASAGLVSSMVRERSDGETATFLYGSGGMGGANIRQYTAGFRYALQSVYVYPFPLEKSDLERRAALPWSAEYYREQYAADGYHPNAGRMMNILQQYARTRRELSPVGEWIPVIQNHAYGFLDNDPHGYPPGDPIWTREPTVREMRMQVNAHLAYGAKGIVYYLFGSTPGADTTDGENVGARGFLTFDHCMGSFNAYGERSWDSLRAFNHGALRALGDTLYSLAWLDGWSMEEYPLGVLPGPLLQRVIAEGDEGRDTDGACLVEAAVFASQEGGDSLRYVMLVNKRVREDEDRRVTVGFGIGPDGRETWRILDVRSGDTLSRGAASLSYAGGIATVDIAPGMARVLRLEAVAGSGNELPDRLRLDAAYPQPADATVVVPCRLPEAGSVTYLLHDRCGRLVRRVRLELARGLQHIAIDSRDLPPGPYMLSVLHATASATARIFIQH